MFTESVFSFSWSTHLGCISQFPLQLGLAWQQGSRQPGWNKGEVCHFQLWPQEPITCDSHTLPRWRGGSHMCNTAGLHPVKSWNDHRQSRFYWPSLDGMWVTNNCDWMSYKFMSEAICLSSWYQPSQSSGCCLEVQCCTSNANLEWVALV